MKHSATEVHDQSVQTGLDVGSLHYNWPSSVVSPTSAAVAADVQYGLSFVDPASVATTVIRSDALEGICYLSLITG